MEAFHILIVEDDKEIREGIEIYLKNQGYQVVTLEFLTRLTEPMQRPLTIPLSDTCPFPLDESVLVHIGPIIGSAGTDGYPAAVTKRLLITR